MQCFYAGWLPVLALIQTVSCSHWCHAHEPIQIVLALRLSVHVDGQTDC